MELERRLAILRQRARAFAGMDSSEEPRPWLPWRAVVASFAAIALLTLLLQVLTGGLELLDTALLYLLLVYAIALLFGSTLAAIASILAFLALDFFSIPPRHSLEIETPEHVVALLVYFGIAVVTGAGWSRPKRTESDRSSASGNEAPCSLNRTN